MMAGLFLKEGISPSFRVVCTGAVKLGNREFRCWRKGGHGAVDMIQSLLHSCDVYYYVLGEKLGIDRIESFAKACGFGAPTGIDLPHEKSGLVPSRAWKKRRSGEAWYRGETLNVSIGQGYTLVTPLQMANFVSSLLNGGKLMKPQLLVDAKPEVRGNIPFSEEARKLVLEGMRVTADVGTAKVLRRTDAVIGGKRFRGARLLRLSDSGRRQNGDRAGRQDPHGRRAPAAYGGNGVSGARPRVDCLIRPQGRKGCGRCRHAGARGRRQFGGRSGSPRRV